MPAHMMLLDDELVHVCVYVCAHRHVSRFVWRPCLHQHISYMQVAYLFMQLFSSVECVDPLVSVYR